MGFRATGGQGLGVSKLQNSALYLHLLTILSTRHMGKTSQPLIHKKISFEVVTPWYVDKTCIGKVTCCCGSFDLLSHICPFRDLELFQQDIYLLVLVLVLA